MQLALLRLLVLLAAAATSSSSLLAPATYTPASSTLNASDFSLWLAASAAKQYNPLILAPGTYTVDAPSTSSSSSSSSLAQDRGSGGQPLTRSHRLRAGSHLIFPPLSGVTVDMTGVTLVLLGRYDTAVLVNDWVNVTLMGLSIRYALPTSNSARIAALPAPGTIDVVVEQGMPLDDWVAGTISSCNAFDNSTRLMKPSTWDLYMRSITPLPQSQGTSAFRIVLQDSNQAEGLEVGDLLGCRLPNGDHTFVIQGAENSTFADITLFGGPLFAFYHTGGSTQGTRGGNTFRRIAVRFPDPPTGALHPPLLSSTADGFHCAGARWGPRIEDSYFEGMNDDAIAIHGFFVLITDADAASNRIWVAEYADLQVGDHLALYDPTFARQPQAQAPSYAAQLFTITNVTAAPSSYAPPKAHSHTIPNQPLGPGQATYRILTLDRELPAGTGFDWALANADIVGTGFVLRNNTIRNHRARGLLIKASDGVIEGNTITNSWLGGIIITPELSWREADYARNLLVANNTIDLTLQGRQSYGGIALGSVNPDNGIAPALNHLNITITGNTVINAPYYPVWLTSAGNVTFSNNRIVSPFHTSDPSTLPQCCEPLPQNQAVAVYADNIGGLLSHGNCVSPAPEGQSALKSVFLATSTVTGDFGGGVQLC